jgi:hypothetical protein
MVARHGLRRWALAALTALAACVEQARSADVVGGPPADAPITAQAYTVEQLAPRAPTVDVGEVSVRVHATPQVVEASSFFGERPDAELRRALSGSGIVKVEKGRGGRSLGFRLQLDSGEKAYFKADQTFSAANWFGEVASYHLDRMLGLGRVPVVVSRTFPWATLAPAAGKDVRVSEIITRNGEVQGALVAWVTGHLQPLPHQPGWERWVRVQGWPANVVSPFQRPAVWKQQITIPHLAKAEQLKRRNLRPEPDREDRAAELSDLIVFDYLTRNQDRWGGENANVLIRGARGPLVFLDNGASFEPGDPRPGLMEARLHGLQRFRRKTIAGARAFDIERFKARLAHEQVQPVLSEAQLAGLIARRKALLEWVAQQESAHGEAIWAWE